jgi:Putative transposase
LGDLSCHDEAARLGLKVDEDAHVITYASRMRPGHGPHATPAAADPNDFLARVVMHIPDPRRDVIRYYGAYSSVIRARRGRETPPTADTPRAKAPAVPAASLPSNTDVRALRQSSAQLIRRIYEVDPLACPRCGATMRIVAFITEPKVIHTILRHLAAKGADQRSPPGSTTPHPAAA